MSAVKERILNAITIMTEEDAIKIWNVIQFQLSVPTDMPTEDELEIFAAYKNGDDEYAPFISHEDLKRKLNLE